MNQLRETLHPGVRGALFYAMYWGVVGICEPFLTVHFMRLGFGEQQIGWLAAVFPFFNFLIAPLVSRSADRANRRRLYLAVTLAGYGAALIIFPLAKTFFVVLLAYALVMSFRSSVVPLADSLIARMAERRALDFGHMRLWGSLFFTITATILGLIWERTGFTAMFISAGFLFFLVIFAALLIEEPPQEVTKPGVRSNKPPAGLPEAGIVCLLAASFLIIGALFMAGTFQTVYMTLLGGNELYVGALFGLPAMAEVPGMLFGRRIARRLGDTNTLLLAYGLMALGFTGMGLSTSPLPLLACAVFRGLGFGLNIFCTVTILNNRAPEGMYATYQGMLNSLCYGLAPLLGGPIAGYLFQALRPGAFFFMTAGMTVLAAFVILPTFRIWRKKTQVRESPLVEG